MEITQETTRRQQSTRRQEVKNYIVAKFGAIPRFADLVGLERMFVHNALRKPNPADMEKIYRQAQETENGPTKHEITQEHRLSLHRFIDANHNGNMSEFCRENGADFQTVLHILAGLDPNTVQQVAKRKSKLVQKIFTAAGIE